jgi:hypothetical protein
MADKNASEPEQQRGEPITPPDEPANVPAYRTQSDEHPAEQAAYRAEIVGYFEERLSRRDVVATTTTTRGQLIDWVPVESQHPRGEIASPPPDSEVPAGRRRDYPEDLARAELELEENEIGPSGTVPLLRKNLDALAYSHPLRQYLSKYRGGLVLDAFGGPVLVPGPGSRGTHWHSRANQPGWCFGGDAQFSCFHPYTASSAEFSLIQMCLTNRDLPKVQTVEAGWQVYRDITGDWAPHLFVYYTTNGYAKDEDWQGGYNTDVDGWVQYDNTIFPGSTFAPLSQIGGEQREITIKYQHYQDNWWLQCQGRWVGYYPGRRLFMGNGSSFTTLGDHADRIGFWGEVAKFGSGSTHTDMGSGRFADEGFGRAAYIHNMRVQTRRDGAMAAFDGSNGLFTTDPNLYDLDPHINSGSNWGSYFFVGGPGSG